MEPTVLVYGLIVLTILLIATLYVLLVYSGLFERIVVGAGKPPIKNVHIAYKFGRGSYSGTGEIFTEVTCLAPKGRCFGVYYDDPKQVPESKLRWAVGCILTEGGVDSVESSEKEAFKKEGYKFFDFPEVSNAVRTKFPLRSTLSVFVGVYRVYPLLGNYVVENRLCAHPWIEIYDNDTIHYMAPLAKQDEFYVPESDTVEDIDSQSELACDDESVCDSSVERSQSRSFQRMTPSGAGDEEKLAEEASLGDAIDETGDHIGHIPDIKHSIFNKCRRKASTPQPISSSLLERDFLAKTRSKSLDADNMSFESLQTSTKEKPPAETPQRTRDSSSEFENNQYPSPCEEDACKDNSTFESDESIGLLNSDTSRMEIHESTGITDETSIPVSFADTSSLSEILPDPLVCESSRLAEYSDEEGELCQEKNMVAPTTKTESLNNGQAVSENKISSMP